MPYKYGKAWFSYVGKIADDQGFYSLPTIPDFTDISYIRQRSSRNDTFICDRELAPSNLGDW